jgi:hypothetical protein
MYANGETNRSVSEIESYRVQRGTSRTVIRCHYHLTVGARMSSYVVSDLCVRTIHEFTYNHSEVKNSSIKPFSYVAFSNVIRWPLSSIPQSLSNVNDADLTRNQLDELKKKMTPIQQMILSLHPKKKYALIEYIPDFEAYDSDTNANDAHLPSSSVIDAYDDGIQGSLSERLYNEMDRQTMRTLSIPLLKVHSGCSLSFRRVSIDGNVSNESCKQRPIDDLQSSVSTHARACSPRSPNLIDQSLTSWSNAKLVKFYFSFLYSDTPHSCDYAFERPYLLLFAHVFTFIL